MHVSILTDRNPNDQIHIAAVYFEGLLRELGYRPRLKVVPFNTMQAAIVGVDNHQRPAGNADMLLGGWIADYPGPNTFFQLFACPPHSAGGCDPVLSRAVHHAVAEVEANPAEATATWRELDRVVTNLAPAVFLFNAQNLGVVSRRVGNVLTSVQDGPLYDQMSLR